MLKFIFLAVFYFCSSCLNAQLSPKGQALMDSMSRWLQSQIQTKGAIDTMQLAKFNAAIRQAEAENNNKKEMKAEAATHGNSKVITKELMSGAVFTVPAGMEWKVQHVYLKDEKTGYRIAIKSDLCGKSYMPGSKIIAPGYAAELALLDNEDSPEATYIFEILETKY